MKNEKFYIDVQKEIGIVIILFAVLIISSMATTGREQVTADIIPNERAQLLIAKLVPPITEETKKLFWDDGKKTMETYFSELREASGGRNEDVVLQLMFFSLQATGTEQAMAAGFIIDQMKISKAEIATALLPFIETDDKALRKDVYNWLGGPALILEARVTLKPEALEVSPGILTAFVRLPDGYPVKNITSATCDGAPSERMMLNEDGSEMIIKFRRQDIEAALRRSGASIDTNFVVRGVWQGKAGSNLFQGVASIKKIVGAKEKEKKK